MMFDNNKLISRNDLKNSKKEDLLRLAKFLGLSVNIEMSNKNLSNLIYWRITRRMR
jgi:hypothetical protein